MSELRIKFHYKNGTADTGRLDLYDASVALKGIARTTSLVTHAFLNGEVRTRGEAADGAEFFLNTPKRGSFEYEAVVSFCQGAVAGGVFYDFIKYALNEAVGKNNQEDSYYKALEKRIEPTIGELPAVLESALDDVHRPIRKEREIVLTVARPRGEPLAVFDSESALYLLPDTIPAPHPIVGNVTKYNTVTGWGRFFDLIENRTVSFNIDVKSSERQRSLITWSLHENNMGREGRLYLKADAVVTPTKKIKRYNVKRVDDKPIE